MKLRLICLFLKSGSDNVISIATSYLLEDSGFEPHWGDIFPPIKSCFSAYTAFFTVGTGSLLRE